MLKYVPGLVAAIAALVAFMLLGFLDLSLQILAFLAVYLIVAIAVDKAMSRYGRSN